MALCETPETQPNGGSQSKTRFGSLRNEGTCFGSDHNKITILEHNKRLDFEFKPKKEVAKDIIKHILSK